MNAATGTLRHRLAGASTRRERPANQSRPVEPQTQLQTTLRQLRLSGLAQTLDVRLQEPAASRLGHADFWKYRLNQHAARNDSLALAV